MTEQLPSQSNHCRLRLALINKGVPASIDLVLQADGVC
jgi:hypothetical protein